MKIKYEFYSRMQNCNKGFFGWVVCFWTAKKYGINGFGWRIFGYQGWFYY